LVRDNVFSEEYYNPIQEKFISLQQIKLEHVLPSTLAYNPQNNFATVSVSNDKNQAGAQLTKIMVP